MKTLIRTDGPLGGVLGGVSAYFGADPTWTRLGFALGVAILPTAAAGVLVTTYLVGWLVIPPN